jgi:catechol 2,3-dioxygenase-like lactoylglutathione lyase family enzyme
MRVQLALNVSDIDEAVDFYTKLFGVEPHKRRDGYANFAVAEPPLKLVLFENPQATERLNHLGVEVFEDAEVDAAQRRMEGAGIFAEKQHETVCCHASQDKVWSRSLDGVSWEWYRILDDEPDAKRDTLGTVCCTGKSGTENIGAA